MEPADVRRRPAHTLRPALPRLVDGEEARQRRDAHAHRAHPVHLAEPRHVELAGARARELPIEQAGHGERVVDDHVRRPSVAPQQTRRRGVVWWCVPGEVGARGEHVGVVDPGPRAQPFAPRDMVPDVRAYGRERRWANRMNHGERVDGALAEAALLCWRRVEQEPGLRERRVVVRWHPAVEVLHHEAGTPDRVTRWVDVHQCRHGQTTGTGVLEVPHLQPQVVGREHRLACRHEPQHEPTAIDEQEHGLVRPSARRRRTDDSELGRTQPGAQPLRVEGERRTCVVRRVHSPLPVYDPERILHVLRIVVHARPVSGTGRASRTSRRAGSTRSRVICRARPSSCHRRSPPRRRGHPRAW